MIVKQFHIKETKKTNSHFFQNTEDKKQLHKLQIAEKNNVMERPLQQFVTRDQIFF